MGFSPELLLIICAAASCVAALLAFIAVLRSYSGRNDGRVLDEFGRMRSETAEQGRVQRQELAANIGQFQAGVQGSVQQLGEFQKERLEQVTRELASLTQRMSDAQTTMRQAVESRLDALRNENMAKLEDMRKTVDEKLQTTLEKRLTESFLQVREQLDRVHKGLGEMQTLASGVGDLKKVLTNIKTRGIWGEMQLGNLLEQFLAPDQYISNAQVKANTGERVEFAVRLPGRNGNDEVLLPIDAKFPQEDYERLITASEQSNHEVVAEASAQLEESVRRFAKSISDKYINPPTTTDFAILFLPTESLYAEMLRRPGFFEKLQHDYHVTLSGPTTLTALLNALQMGFRSLAIEKRSSEVWQVLGAVRTEFNKYGDVVNRLKNQLQTAVNTIDALGTRTKQMGRKLGSVDSLPQTDTDRVLGFDEAHEAREENEDNDDRDILPLAANK
jgi:DNA recombination protein RmuC